MSSASSTKGEREQARLGKIHNALFIGGLAALTVDDIWALREDEQSWRNAARRRAYEERKRAVHPKGT